MSSTSTQQLVTNNGLNSAVLTARQPRSSRPSVSAINDEKNPKALDDLRAYLVFYNDLGEGHQNDPKLLSDALQKFQRIGGIPETGIYDEATENLMKLPRCPNRMNSASSDKGSDARTGFAATTNPWNHTPLTYRFENVTPDFNGTDAYAAIQQAMSRWSNVTDIAFMEVQSAVAADIVISWTFKDRGDGTNFDGPGGSIGNYLAWTNATVNSAGKISCTIRFDEYEDWGRTLVYQTALHELGHALGLGHNDSAFPQCVMHSILHGENELQPDDMAGVHSLYGWRDLKWQVLDNNTLTASLHSSSSGIGFSVIADGLYQLHLNGNMWHYVGPPMTGWFNLDNNPKTRQITATAGLLYQRREDGTVLQYAGTKNVASWQVIDNSLDAMDILAAGVSLYATRKKPFTSIWKYTPASIPTWQQIQAGSTSIDDSVVQLAGSSNGQLYQRRSNGQILYYDTSKTPPVWTSLDNNSQTIFITAGADNLYQLHNDGSIFAYNWSKNSWFSLDNNTATKKVFAAGNGVYQLHNDGTTWRYTGNPGIWELLDKDPPATSSIIADDNLNVWLLKRDGRILRLNS